MLKARLGIDRTGFEISPENCKLTFSFCTPQTVVYIPIYYSTEWLVDIIVMIILKNVLFKNKNTILLFLLSFINAVLLFD